MNFYQFSGTDLGLLVSPTGAKAVTLPTPLTPLPFDQKLIATGHSIIDGVLSGQLQDAITAMGGSADLTVETTPGSGAMYRWTTPAGGGKPDVKALMEAPGAAYDVFLGIEAAGGVHQGRSSVWEHIYWSQAREYALLWHNLAASTGARPAYANFCRDDTAELFDDAWWDSHFVTVDPANSPLDELEHWDSIIDYVNANRDEGTPAMVLVPWMQVFLAVHTAIKNGDVTGITTADLFFDHIHIAEGAGCWLQLCTMLYVLYRRHPSTMPANAGTRANISEPLAAQLRPIVAGVCVGLSRTGLS